MLTHSSRWTRSSRRLTLLALSLILILGTVGCSRMPRNHWWQFWRPKAADASVYKPDTQVLPPPPDSLDQGGASSALTPDGSLPPPPGAGSMSEPDPMRRAAKGVSQMQTVHFDFDSADLSDAARQILDANSAWIIANPNYQIQIEGHTDERGTTEYNLNLGDRRAKAVKAYLMTKGVPGDRLHTISYGEERPVDPGQSEPSWVQNRRAQFLVY